MTTIRGDVTAELAADAGAVFDTITDIGRLPSWNAVMTRVCDQPATLEAGSEWVVEFHVLGRTWGSRSRCELIDRDGRLFSHRTQTDDGNPSYANWQWVVTPLGDRSEVHVSWELHPATFWRRVLLARVRNRQLARTEVPASLAALEQAVTAAGSAA